MKFYDTEILPIIMGVNIISNLRRELPLNSAHHFLLSQMFSIGPMIDRRLMDIFHQDQILWQMPAEIEFLQVTN